MTFPLLNVIRVLLLPGNRAGNHGVHGDDTTTQPSTTTTRTPPEHHSSSDDTQRTPWLVDLFMRHVRLSTYALLTWISYIWFFPLHQAAVWEPRWMLTVVLRNFAVEILFYAFWHWFLYSATSPGAHRMKPQKFNPINPYEDKSRAHLPREVLFTTLGFCMSSAFEIGMMHAWATGAVSMYGDFWAFPLWSVANILVIPYWRDAHFWFIHRVIHPWRVSIFGVDPGKVLYHHVHSLHHKSHNPGPWSGLSMHPLEHFLYAHHSPHNTATPSHCLGGATSIRYYTCTLLPLVMTLHPAHFLFAKFHADVSPVAGHDGHDQPGGGSHFLYLHHAYFDCNYGTPMVPLDKLFNTFRQPKPREQ